MLKRFDHAAYAVMSLAAIASLAIGMYCATNANPAAGKWITSGGQLGLLQTPESVSPREAEWVTCRAAELLQWDQPTLSSPPKRPETS
jgi:hypothetical protein